MNGEDLQQCLEQVFQIPEYETKKISKDISEALNYLHNLKIGHRDVKLENICLQTNSNSLVTTTRGSVSYISSKILQRKSYGLNVDCWGLGVVIYSLLVGYRPFRSDDDDELSLNRVILNDQKLSFGEKDWNGIFMDSKDLFTTLLKKDLNQRMERIQVMKHT